MRNFSLTGIFSIVIAGVFIFVGPPTAFAQKGQAAFKIGGKTTTIGELEKENKGAFYEVEEKKYELVENLAQEKFLDYFWQKLAKEKKKSVEAAKNEYLDSKVSVSDAEVKENAERYKDSPQLAKLSTEEREKQVREVLKSRAKWAVTSKIISDAKKSGEFKVLYQKPEEPVFAIQVRDNIDHVRYGPDVNDIKPIQCKGNECPITIIEYSEFQCPYCGRVISDVMRLLTDYKGKVRWVTRDFTLPGHDRARPAAVAAHCAGDQGKFWHMYKKLFENQRNLGDSDLEKYAKDSGVDMGKWSDCVKNKSAKEALIDENVQSGSRNGVNGTPAFFINGRRLSGALPYEEFKRVIDEELAKKKK